MKVLPSFWRDAAWDIAQLDIARQCVTNPMHALLVPV